MFLTTSKKLLGLSTLVITLGLIYFGVHRRRLQVESSTYQFPLTHVSRSDRTQELETEIAFYQKRLKTNPSSFSNLSALAAAYASLAKVSGNELYFDRARETAQASLKEMPSYNIQALYILANVAQAQHHFEEALGHAQKILKQKPNAPEAYLLLANCQLARGEPMSALENVNKLISADPTENAYTLRALILAQMGRDAEATSDFNVALKKEIDDQAQATWTRVMYGRFLLSRGEYPEGKGLLTEALRLSPDSDLAAGVLAEYYLRTGKHIEAKNWYRKAFSLSHRLPYLYGEARALELSGNTQSSQVLVSQTESLLRQDLAENKTGHLNELILLLLDRNAPTDRPEALALAMKESENRANPETLILLARAYEASHKLTQAKEVVDRMLSKKMKTPEIYLEAKRIEAALKNDELSGLYQKRLEDMHPRYEDDVVLNTSN